MQSRSVFRDAQELPFPQVQRVDELVVDRDPVKLRVVSPEKDVPLVAEEPQHAALPAAFRDVQLSTATHRKRDQPARFEPGRNARDLLVGPASKHGAFVRGA